MAIAITPEPVCPDEPARIRALIDAGFSYVHIRHPRSREADIRRMIEEIPADCYGRLRIHDHHGIAEEMGLAGIHLNSRNPLPPAGYRGGLSRSCHSIGELACRGDYDYVFLSPVFDSVSKVGYQSAFRLADLRRSGGVDGKVVALGGVLPERVRQLREAGFGGCAVLGYLFAAGDEREFMARAKEIIKQTKI